MQTIILEKPEHFTLKDTLGPGEVTADYARVSVRRIGICGTDLHAYRGRQPFFNYPRILGHELGVEIAEIGDNDLDLHPGDTCAVEPYLTCGKCIACRRQKPNCCIEMQVLGVHIDGGMREQIRVPINKLHKSDRLTLDQLSLIEMLGIGAHAVERAQLEPGEFVLVIGAGPIGLSVIQFAQLAGVQLIVMDINQNRLAFCREHFGIQWTIEAQNDPLSQLETITKGDLPTVVFDATGNTKSMEGAFSYVSNGGKLVFVGLVQSEIAFSDPEFHRREITLLATRNSTPKDFKRIISLVEQEKVDTKPWITHRASFQEMIAVFPTWLVPESNIIKAVVSLDS